MVAKTGLQNTYYGGKIDLKKQEVFSYKSNNSGGWQPDVETDVHAPAGRPHYCVYEGVATGERRNILRLALAWLISVP